MLDRNRRPTLSKPWWGSPVLTHHHQWWLALRNIWLLATASMHNGITLKHIKFQPGMAAQPMRTRWISKQVKKGLWRNWKKLTVKIREEVGKNISKCGRWFTKVDAYWNIVKTFHKGKTHAHCTTHISWTSWKRRDKWSLNTSLRLLKLVWSV